MSETKKCAQCGHEKPIEDFSKSYKNLCKDCVAENERLKREVNKAFGVAEDMPNNSFLYCGRGIEVPIPEDAVFINPMRFQASVAAMQGMLASGYYTNNSPDFIARRAVIYADALIDRLKGEEDEKED